MLDTYQGQRESSFQVRNKIEFFLRIRTYTTGMDPNVFVTDERTYDATLQNLELICKAVTHIPKLVRDAHPGIPRRSIIGERNLLIHVYCSIDNDLIWSIPQDDVQVLRLKIRHLLGTTSEYE